MTDLLERGRGSYAAGGWAAAHESLSAADQVEPLRAQDLERLARAAYMLGRDDEYIGGLERAHHAHLDAGRAASAAACAFWIGHNLVFRGETAPAQGWFARAERLLEGAGDCAERGYVLIATLLDQIVGGNPEAARDTATEIASIGRRFEDPDLVAVGLMEEGHALVRQGRTAEGLRLVDETMVAVTAGELSPIVAGIVYCNTIAFCRDVYELRRAREWTSALTRWCDQQPDMVAHKGLCLVHRAELMQLGGAWPEALAEARRVGDEFTKGVLNQRALGHAAYRQGEVHRLRGDFDAAEAAYREASRFGREPQPGLALLRLAQGDRLSAAAAIRRALSEADQPLNRVALLPAYIEIMLALQHVDEARSACRELQAIGERQQSDAVAAMAAQGRGAVELAAEDADSALVSARSAWRAWLELDAPYEAARARVLIGQARAALGDAENASLELEGARSVFDELGAAHDVELVDSLAGSRPSETYGLTARELEVLRLAAAGKSNREIAAELVISEHTARRHLQNIYGKLGVSSRAAATAFGLRHGLI
jgi:DNA-binding CsgD family transcriptional regulator